MRGVDLDIQYYFRTVLFSRHHKCKTAFLNSSQKNLTHFVLLSKKKKRIMRNYFIKRRTQTTN